MAGKAVYLLFMSWTFCIMAATLAIKHPFLILVKDNGDDLHWDAKLLNRESPEFQQLAKRVRPKISVLFLNLTDFYDVLINHFYSGSVYANFTLVLQDRANTTREVLTTIVNKTKWIDLSTGSPPRVFVARVSLFNQTWSDSLSDKTSKDYAFMIKYLNRTIVTLLRRIPGFQEVVVLEFIKETMISVGMEIRILFDSRSLVIKEDLQKMIESLKGSNSSSQFKVVSIHEVKPPTEPKPGKPAWLVVIIALTCMAIIIGMIAFVFRVFKQSFLAPKFKLAEVNKPPPSATTANGIGRRSATGSNETLASEAPHQNCVSQTPAR